MKVIYTNEPVKEYVNGELVQVRTGDVIYDDGVSSLPNYPYAEEIPISIFGGYPHFADHTNTKKINGEWAFSFDPQVAESNLVEVAKADRDHRIQAMSWRFERHASELRLGITPTEDIAPLDAYVQALRDIPQQDGFPSSVVWPEAPNDRPE